MRNRTPIVLAALLGLLPATIAWRTAGEPLSLEAGSRLWIDGESTVRTFSCRAPVFAADVDAAQSAAAAVPSGTKAVRAVTFTVPAAKMDRANGTTKVNPVVTVKLELPREPALSAAH